MEPLDRSHAPLDRDLGACLALLRSVRRWSQRELAERSGIRATTISHIEDGRQHPKGSTLERLLQALGFSYTHLDLAREFLDLLGPIGPSFERGREARSSEDARPEPDPGPVELRRLLDRCMEGLTVLGSARTEEPEARSDSEPGSGQAVEDTCESGRAEELWAKLRKLSFSEQQARIRSDPDLGSPALCELLCECSVAEAVRRPNRSLQTARLAVAVAAAIEARGLPAGLLVALAKGHEANALRVCSRQREAVMLMDETVLQAAMAGIGEGPLRFRIRLLDLEASVRFDQRRLADSVILLEQALALPASEVVRGRLSISKARALEELGDLPAAIADLRAAHALIDPEAESHLHLCVIHNLADALSKGGYYEEARTFLPEVRKLSRRLGNELDLVRLEWVEGRIAAGLGESEQAIELLTRVRGAFSSRSLDYDTALVTLELAVVLLGLGRTAEVKTLARHLVPIFQSQSIHREALAALSVFRQAAEREALSVEAAQEVADYFKRARFDPALAFPRRG